MMDAIIIDSLECQAHVGVPESERRRKQKVLIDIELGLDLQEAGRGDQVKATVDYAAVVRQVKEVVEGGSFKLVEAMAEKIADAVLWNFRPVSVRVRIRKFSVPGTASVGVEIKRGTLHFGTH